MRESLREWGILNPFGFDTHTYSARCGTEAEPTSLPSLAAQARDRTASPTNMKERHTPMPLLPPVSQATPMGKKKTNKEQKSSNSNPVPFLHGTHGKKKNHQHHHMLCLSFTLTTWRSGFGVAAACVHSGRSYVNFLVKEQ